ncbi:MAG TPA: 23S rRNA pseudouridine(2604) synthase RluF [Bacillota bacterium]|nr:23S rRNA pseudouridine(2604) synthase RluF [Bacillota bacterium]HOR85479.1 23S rRNA pseudouridine(2604) synthase RluF [Bacillota bacterium]HPL54631.1 23S rRNA pseudouridine(2604) synthase RluF [Bacillota bacterium]
MKNVVKANTEQIESMRINKYISEKGVCSRREADELINQRKVTINGKTAEMGSKVYPGDVVKVKGKPLKPKSPPVYLAFNKPPGIVCTTDKKEKDNIIDFINYPKRIFPIGRLDKYSEGLIFLTSDGDIVNKILRAENNHEKEYIVAVNKPVTEDFIKSMAAGVKILGTITKKCKATQISKYAFKIVLTEGMNRQIRRMCEVFGYKVLNLRRVRIMNVTLGPLPPGRWRYLTAEELRIINNLISKSVKAKEST